MVDACLRRFPRARRVLDLGGGHGEQSLEFARRGLRPTMQDRPEVVEIAERRGQLGNAGVELFAGDFFTTLPPGPFDLVICGLTTNMYDGARNRDLYRRPRPITAPAGGLAIEPGPPAHVLEVGPGALPAADVHQHVEVTEVAQPRRARLDHLGQHWLHDQHPAAVRQGTAAVAEEGDDSIVVPVVNDALQQVQVALRHLGEEVPERDLAAVGDPGPRQQIRRLRDPGSGVEHDAPQVGVSTQDGSEQCPVPTADVDHGGEPGEVVGTGSTAAVPWVPWLIEALNSADSSGFCSR